MDYKPNSHKSKSEQEARTDKKIEKVTKGVVKTKKKSEIRKFTDEFISEDVNNLKTYIFKDVLIPAVKKAISDTVDTLLYGETRNRKTGSNTSKVAYGGFFNGGNNDRRSADIRARTTYNYDDVTFTNRGDAEDVLFCMDELIQTYKMVSVADFYELAGVSSPSYTANRYGWTDISTAAVVRVRDGFMIRLPRALPFD